MTGEAFGVKKRVRESVGCKFFFDRLKVLGVLGKFDRKRLVCVVRVGDQLL